MKTYKTQPRALVLLACLVIGGIFTTQTLFAGALPPSDTDTQETKKSIFETVKDAAKSATDAVETVVDTTKNAVNTAADVAENAKNVVVDTTKKVVDTATGVVESTKDAVVNTTEATSAKIKNTTIRIVDTAEQKANTKLLKTKSSDLNKRIDEALAKASAKQHAKVSDQGILKTRAKEIQGLYIRLGYPSELGYRLNNLYIGAASHFDSLGVALSYNLFNWYVDIGADKSPLIFSVGPHVSLSTNFKGNLYSTATVLGRIAYQIPVNGKSLDTVEIEGGLDLGMKYNSYKDVPEASGIGFGWGLFIGTSFLF